MTVAQLLNAFAYELVLWLTLKYPWLKTQPWVDLLSKQCMPDWITWKMQRLGAQIDEQVKQLHQDWDLVEQQQAAPIYSEKPPDGSKAQESLGGEMRLRAPWVKE